MVCLLVLESGCRRGALLRLVVFGLIVTRWLLLYGQLIPVSSQVNELLWTMVSNVSQSHFGKSNASLTVADVTLMRKGRLQSSAPINQTSQQHGCWFRGQAKTDLGVYMV
ncbi:hypothetical protein Rs2_21641 [Raphanus sativus]|nr:hypothetical protein Rs2_21641 [Raphanus sativus]